jgi:hypothetical protein
MLIYEDVNKPNERKNVAKSDTYPTKQEKVQLYL